MTNNNCCSYLEVLVARFKSEMDQSIVKGERAPARTKEMWMECTKRLLTIQAACQQQAMTEADYKQALEQQLKKDTNLLNYFAASGDKKKAAIVQERVKFIKDELSEM
jgi:hypothetical protein